MHRKKKDETEQIFGNNFGREAVSTYLHGSGELGFIFHGILRSSSLHTY